MQNYRIFNRFELKFVLDYEQADMLRSLIAPYVKPDDHNGPNGYYAIASLYYDSPDYTCFWEKLDGVKFRRKLRIRRYGDDNSGKGYLEIKQRIDKTVQKRRVSVALRTAMPDGKNCGVQGWEDLGDPVSHEAICMVHMQQMSPRMLVGYNREAYFGSYESGLRVTFDRNLRCKRFRDGASLFDRQEQFLIPPHLMVLEVKFNNSVPTWLCTCLNRLNLQSSRVSKYCHAVNRLEYNGTLI